MALNFFVICRFIPILDLCYFFEALNNVVFVSLLSKSKGYPLRHGIYDGYIGLLTQSFRKVSIA